MVRRKRKRWSKDWHHRVPDFKLVYCGQKKTTLKEETKHTHEKKTVEASVTNNGNSSTVVNLEKKM